jgi:hypothetical protein
LASGENEVFSVALDSGTVTVVSDGRYKLWGEAPDLVWAAGRRRYTTDEVDGRLAPDHPLSARQDGT